ncbi:MAG: bacteriohemerythrin [Desulfococcaceae bacterium]
MIYFRWNDKYSIGIEEIDAQHRQLVQMVNELYEAMYAGQGREALGKVLSSLILYTQTHFQTEERFMKLHDYPGYDGHKQIHEKMAAKVLDLQNAFHRGEVSNPVQISNFLKAWLVKHILKTDRKYADFYQQKKKTAVNF